MARSHAILINLSSWSPLIFEFNPESVKSKKKINYSTAPNIGGAYKEKFFSGFDAKEIEFNLVFVDKESPTGITEEVAFFEQLREPDPGVTGGWGLTYGNLNYPPPKVLFQFGVSYVPLVWDVLDIDIKVDHFYSGIVRGLIGIPKKAEIQITLSLDEGDVLNQANQIAKKAEMYAASIKSITREVVANTMNRRKEMPGLFNGGTTLDKSSINSQY